MPYSRKTALLAAVAGSCVLGLSAALPAGAASGGSAGAAGSTADTQGKAMVSVFHGVPGMTVDVYAGDKELIPDFEPGTLTDPMPLQPGSYDLKVFPDGSGPGDGKPAMEKTVEVRKGSNATVAAHLSADGTPKLSAYANDTSKVPAGESRLTVRHVAAAPAVDVRADGKAVFRDLSNPQEKSAEVAPGTVSADVVLAGTDQVAIGPADLPLEEGTHTVVYAWGSAEDDSLALKTQTLSGMHSAPGGVPAGEGDAMAGGNDSTAWLAAGGAGAAVLAAGAVLTARRRAAAQEH
ncbi:DUF4397 domain-containing protein [Streptomyces sp. JJ36]|uniref:DUF4397 domain-containing protein n=1 Tax=Streptomyces sp. JJ36 TaxID=2736645 RepID=UPI001F389A97|nr:DUF4397 domain-containing protein [Streptomyces sp. JJ36]MCF6524525.1 DUF4397 domain-containing protein [Streptomyces sp. JJ36]